MIHLTRKGSMLGAGASLRIIDEGQVVDQGRHQAKETFQWRDIRPKGASSSPTLKQYTRSDEIPLPAARDFPVRSNREPLYHIDAVKEGARLHFYAINGALENVGTAAIASDLRRDGWSVSMKETGEDLLTFSGTGTKVGHLGYNGELSWCRKAGPYRLMWLCQKELTCGVPCKTVTLQPGKKYHFSLEPVWLDTKNVTFGTTQLRLVSVELLNQ
ncbi:MAG: hypothetical protein J0M04_18220 [Verrucomicrobia bacterium]|nr:hypothetical protein [Verrucomicrobiota bacterium]